MSYDVHDYYESAVELGLDCVPYPDISAFKIILGKHTYWVMHSVTPFNNTSSNEVSHNKYITNRMLYHAGVPVPETTCITAEDYFKDSYTLNGITYPLVIKPNSNAGGGDVLCNVRSEEELEAYLDFCFKERGYNILDIEKFYGGLNNYRVIMAFGRVQGVVERIPASVIGDGKHDISNLVILANIERERYQGVTTLGPIKLNREAQTRLEEQGVTEDYVPAKGERIWLSYICNASCGGITYARGKRVSPENARLFRKVLKELGLTFAGIDVMCEDIERPIGKCSRGLIIETNDPCDISVHEHPVKGKPISVSKHILRGLIVKHPVLYMRSRIKKIFKALWNQRPQFKFRALIWVSFAALFVIAMSGKLI